jgi:hypothetical protein
MKFMTGLRDGRYKPSDVDKFIGEWHNGSTPESLPSHLGMTFTEYTAWVEGKVELEDLAKRPGYTTIYPPRPSLFARMIGWLVERICGLPR